MWRKLLLRALLVADELDVVDQQHIGGAEALLEHHRLLLPDRLNELVHEPFGGEVEDPPPRLAAADAPRDRVQQVGLAEPDAAVEVERVEREAIHARDLLRRGVGELVRLADHEFAECEAAIERRAEIGQCRILRPGGRAGTSACRRRLADRALFTRRGRRQARMDHDAGAQDAFPLAGPEGRDAIGITGGDPVAKEPRGDAKSDLFVVDFDQDQRCQPARKGGFADIRAKPRADTLPGVLGIPGRRCRGVRHRLHALRRPAAPHEHDRVP